MIRFDTKKDYELYNSKIEENAKLEQENEKLKENWNKLKKLFYQKYYNGERIDIKDILDKMQELERGCDSNE